jgi:hypothetical protein
VLCQSRVEHQIVIEGLDIGVTEDLSFDRSFDVAALEEVSVGDFVGMVEIPLSKAGNRCDFVNAELVLIFFEEIEQIFVEDTLNQRLQNL